MPSKKWYNPIQHGIEKEPRQSFFCTKDLLEIVLQCCNLLSSSNCHLLCNHVFHDFGYPGICYKTSTKWTLIESFFNIFINPQYLPSSIFTNFCKNNGGGLGIGTTFWVTSASFSIIVLDSPLTSFTSISYLVSISTPYDICGSMVCLLSRVGTVIQCSSFFEFRIVLIIWVPSWHRFNLVQLIQL